MLKASLLIFLLCLTAGFANSWLLAVIAFVLVVVAVVVGICLRCHSSSKDEKKQLPPQVPQRGRR